MKTLLKNGRMVTKENTCHQVDIWVEDKKVFAIGLDFAEKDFDQVIDLKGKLVRTPCLPPRISRPAAG